MVNAVVCAWFPDSEHPLVFAGIKVIITIRADLVFGKFQILQQILFPRVQEISHFFCKFLLRHRVRDFLLNDEPAFFFFHASIVLSEIILFSGL